MIMMEKNCIVKNCYIFVVEGCEGLFWEVDNVFYFVFLIKVECEFFCEGIEYFVFFVLWCVVNVLLDCVYDNVMIVFSGNVLVYFG